MEPEHFTPQQEPKSIWTSVTPFSKYLALILFIAMPFIGGWVGYRYASVEFVEVESITEVVEEKPTEKNLKADPVKNDTATLQKQEVTTPRADTAGRGNSSFTVSSDTFEEEKIFLQQQFALCKDDEVFDEWFVGDEYLSCFWHEATERMANTVSRTTIINALKETPSCDLVSEVVDAVSDNLDDLGLEDECLAAIDNIFTDGCPEHVHQWVCGPELVFDFAMSLATRCPPTLANDWEVYIKTLSVVEQEELVNKYLLGDACEYIEEILSST